MKMIIALKIFKKVGVRKMKKEFDSLKELFEYLNGKVNYVVLRNYELIEKEELMKKRSDLDILCDDKEKIIKITGAEFKDDNQDSWKLYIRVAGKKLQLDVTTVGDGYFDKKWQNNMLRNRKLYKGRFYVLREDDYFYSMLYHVLFQKRSVPYDYQKKLVKLAKQHDTVCYHVKGLLPNLVKYMKCHSYHVTTSSVGLQLNFDNIPFSLLRLKPLRYERMKLKEYKSFLKK